MSPRLPKDKAAPELVHLVDAADGLDLFAPDPDRSQTRMTAPGRRARRATHSSSNAGPGPAAGPRPRSPIEETAPELVWLDNTEGLEEFASERDRPLMPGAAALPAESGPSSPVTDVPMPPPANITGWPSPYVGDAHLSGYGWMKRAGRAALVCAVLAAAADGLLQPPAPAPATIAPQEPALDVASMVAEAGPARAVERTVPAVVRTAARSVAARVADRRAAREPLPTRAQRPDGSSGPNVAARPGSIAAARPAPALASAPAAAAPAPARLAAVDLRTSAPPPAPEAAATLTAARATTPAPVAAVAAPPTAPATAASTAAPLGLSPLAAGSSAAARAATPAAETARGAAAEVPVPAAAATGGRELEARAIQNVLGRYRSAFNTLDAGAAAAVWPSVNEKTLARAFDSLEDQDVSFERCQIEIVAVLAEAACSGSARYVPKVGSRTPRAEARQWKFSLRKADDGWLIDRVDAR